MSNINPAAETGVCKKTNTTTLTRHTVIQLRGRCTTTFVNPLSFDDVPRFRMARKAKLSEFPLERHLHSHTIHHAQRVNVCFRYDLGKLARSSICATSITTYIFMPGHICGHAGVHVLI